MKKTYFISLFLIFLLLNVCAVAAYFFVVGNISGTGNSTTGSKTAPVAEETPGTAVFTGNAREDVVTRDTKYILEKYNAQTYTLEELELSVPVEMLGLNRTELSDYIKQYEYSPTLEDINEGFLNIELLSFSKDKIIIRKYYEGTLTVSENKKEQAESCYILLAERNFVSVYENDYEHLYTHTDICMDSLPPELQQEILDGKILKNIGELYTFLESYTS